MAIRELSDERRNIMLPRVPRLAYFVPSVALNFTLPAAWTLIGPAYTHAFSVTGDEIVFAYFGYRLDSITDANLYQGCFGRIQETTTATQIALRGDMARFDVGKYNSVGMYNGMLCTVAGSPYTIECQARNITQTEQVDLRFPDFSVWMIRN